MVHFGKLHYSKSNHFFVSINTVNCTIRKNVNVSNIIEHKKSSGITITSLNHMSFKKGASFH